MTSTYTDADVARYSAAIIDSKYPPEQAGALKVLFEKILLQDQIMSMDIDQSDSGDAFNRRMTLDVEYRKER